jgi:hypothetical protein
MPPTKELLSWHIPLWACLLAVFLIPLILLASAVFFAEFETLWIISVFYLLLSPIYGGWMIFQSFKRRDKSLLARRIALVAGILTILIFLAGLAFPAT